MRSRLSFGISVIAIAAGCLSQMTVPVLAQDSASVLPGARPTIDASKFTSLQAAFDAVPEGGGLVRLPAGTFEITEPLRVHSEDTCVEGAGTATHIKNLNVDGQPALLVSHLECIDAKTDRKHQLWRIRLANLRITGNEKSGPGIEARQINEIFIDGVTVSENGGDGIFLNYCYEDPRVANCLLTYNKKVGLNLQGCHDIVVSGCQFEENQDALHCFDGFNLCMTGCCVDDHLGEGVVIENTYGSVVSGNMIEECNGTAVVLDRDCYGITLSANVIAHNGGGIDLRDAHGCAVSANTFTILKTNALRIGPNSGRITVGGNNFSNSYIGDGKVRRGTEDLGAAGLVLEATKDVSISGNVFSGLTEKAITLVGESTGVVFANNVLSDVESDHTRITSGTVSNNEESQSSGGAAK
ncbi:MAG TPA: right-handed parallel beta-helix repeat-containing protein [Pirellulaceae bacterium]|nr:right-handed parallel beta-helix repeat-containing protein [Planctomycetales bacterium]MCB9940760.1 right-handed parallel beta-helix repeat-containing protein [Planctomycetaceae bacterium]HRX79035.1 right-handed parallel beta-helix repeat-containing protein [Pirellulaceae bacterium]